jgi:inhibitor of KinA
LDKFALKYRSIGSRAVEIYGFETSENLLWVRHETATMVQNYYGQKVSVNEGYESVMILLLDEDLKLSEVIAELENALNDLPEETQQSKRTWKLPICYDVNGADLFQVAQYCKLSTELLISKHLNGLYMVEFIGFLPGFPYLSGLSEELFIPRKQTPSRAIESGSVAIAAGQCGIYPRESPGGWYVLGKCPLDFFNVKRAAPGFLEIGDAVQFYQINQMEFDFLKSQPMNPIDYLNG